MRIIRVEKAGESERVHFLQHLEGFFRRVYTSWETNSKIMALEDSRNQLQIHTLGCVKSEQE